MSGKLQFGAFKGKYPVVAIVNRADGSKAIMEIIGDNMYLDGVLATAEERDTVRLLEDE